jgi:hypothetical protein
MRLFVGSVDVPHALLSRMLKVRMYREAIVHAITCLR